MTMCQVCEQEPAVWHTVTIIDHGRHRIEGDLCEECGGDIIDAGMHDEAWRLDEAVTSPTPAFEDDPVAMALGFTPRKPGVKIPGEPDHCPRCAQEHAERTARDRS